MVGVIRSQANLLTDAVNQFAGNYVKDFIVSTHNILPTVVSAAGTTQNTAIPLTSQSAIVTVCAPGAGVIATLPYHTVYNRSANPVLFYPASGAQFEALGVNAPVSVGVGDTAELFTTSSAQGYIDTAYNTLSAVVSAAGTTQNTATLLPSQNAIVTVCASGAGVIATLPYHKVYSRGSFPVLFYPASGAQFEALGANAFVSVAVGDTVELFMTSSTQGYVDVTS